LQAAVEELHALIGDTESFEPAEAELNIEPATEPAWVPSPAIAHDATPAAWSGTAPRPAAAYTSNAPVRELVHWDAARMSTGVETVDQQHRQLVTMINRLHTACQQGKGKQELAEMISFLGKYAQEHFSHEEGVMDQHQCPARGANKLAHARFLQDYTELVAAFERSGGSGTTAMVLKLKDMVANWLVNHICSVDTGLKDCPGVCNAAAPAAMGDIPMPDEFTREAASKAA
jgi:hemerythrin